MHSRQLYRYSTRHSQAVNKLDGKKCTQEWSVDDKLLYLILPPIATVVFLLIDNRALLSCEATTFLCKWIELTFVLEPESHAAYGALFQSHVD